MYSSALRNSHTHAHARAQTGTKNDIFPNVLWQRASPDEVASDPSDPQHLAAFELRVTFKCKQMSHTLLRTLWK